MLWGSLIPSNRNWTDDQHEYSLLLFQLSYTRNLRHPGIEPEPQPLKGWILTIRLMTHTVSCRIWTYAGCPNRFQVYRLNHSAKLTRGHTGIWTQIYGFKVHYAHHYIIWPLWTDEIMKTRNVKLIISFTLYNREDSLNCFK